MGCWCGHLSGGIVCIWSSWCHCIPKPHHLLHRRAKRTIFKEVAGRINQLIPPAGLPCHTRACQPRWRHGPQKQFYFFYSFTCLPSMLWRCWLGGRKGIRPVKTEWWATGVVICLERGADLHMAQLMPLPLTVSCSSKIQIGFTFLVPAHPSTAGQRAVKRV